MSAQLAIQQILDLSAHVRYVALYVDGRLTSAERPGLASASSSESDKSEELIVNPTLLTLVTQRGHIDRGGARFVLIRYGDFYEYVRPVRGGHASVGLELATDPLALARRIDAVLSDQELG